VKNPIFKTQLKTGNKKILSVKSLFKIIRLLFRPFLTVGCEKSLTGRLAERLRISDLRIFKSCYFFIFLFTIKTENIIPGEGW